VRDRRRDGQQRSEGEHNVLQVCRVPVELRVQANLRAAESHSGIFL
jgi:hypothetical protein